MRQQREIGPQTTTEFMAWTFTMLGNAYTQLAAYEHEEQKREEDKRRRLFEEAVMQASTPKFADRTDPAKSPGAHREDEQL